MATLKQIKVPLKLGLRRVGDRKYLLSVLLDDEEMEVGLPVSEVSMRRGAGGGWEVVVTFPNVDLVFPQGDLVDG